LKASPTITWASNLGMTGWSLVFSFRVSAHLARVTDGFLFHFKKSTAPNQISRSSSSLYTYYKFFWEMPMWIKMTPTAGVKPWIVFIGQLVGSFQFIALCL
jgi:hypothetical protein